MDGIERPQLRMLEAIPLRHNGEVYVCLRDPEGLLTGQAIVPAAAAPLLAMMDGRHTLREIQARILSAHGQMVASDDLGRLIRQLDEAYLLEGPRLEERRRQVWEAFRNEPIRRAAHAGGAYEAEADALQAQLASLFTSEDGPGALPLDGPAPQEAAADGQGKRKGKRNRESVSERRSNTTSGRAAPLTPTLSPGRRESFRSDSKKDAEGGRGLGRLRAVLSPHIDLRRGGPTFAWAYKELLERSEAEVFVVFGTAHKPTRHRFALTHKHYDTPLGTVETDRAFVDRVLESAGGHLLEDELAHRDEHSIEFQALFLQFLLRGKRKFRIVPILCGSFHDFLEAGTEPREAPDVAAFIAAVREAEAACGVAVSYISGGDLAHIGMRFGDRELLDDVALERLARQDREMLEALEGGEASGLFRNIAGDGDRRRICGLAPTYVMLEAAGAKRGKLLRYDQAVDEERTGCVSFASMGFYEAR